MTKSKDFIYNQKMYLKYIPCYFFQKIHKEKDST